MRTNNQDKKSLFNPITNSFSDDFRFPNSTHGFYFTTSCKHQKECQQARSITKDDLNIVITGKSYDDIARLTFIGCNIDPTSCSNILFTLNAKGKIDKDKLLINNPFFGKIEGFLKNNF